MMWLPSFLCSEPPAAWRAVQVQQTNKERERVEHVAYLVQRLAQAEKALEAVEHALDVPMHVSRKRPLVVVREIRLEHIRDACERYRAEVAGDVGSAEYAGDPL